MRHFLATPVLAALILSGGVALCAGCANKNESAKAKASSQPSAAAPTQLIPRRLVFGNPDRSSVEISPDGRHVSFLAPRNGVMNVFVAAADNPSMATPVTNDTTRGIPAGEPERGH